MPLGIGEAQAFEELRHQVQVLIDRVNKLNGDVSYLKGLLKQKGIKVEDGVPA
jgi:hypothetical protein